MRQEQFVRFVEEICFLLKLSEPCSKTALQYFMQFKEYEHTHFDQEIVIGACIYLSTKIFQEEVRVRDILNMIYVLTSLYKVSQREALQQREEREKIEAQSKHKEHKQIDLGKQQRIEQERLGQNKANSGDEQGQNDRKQSHQEERQPYILLKNIQSLPDLHSIIQPHYSLSDYNEYKSRIIEAEQTLLRILGFDFSLSQKNRTQLKQLLVTFHHLRLPSTIAQTIIKVYNDLHYIDVELWLEGLIYFGFLLVKNHVKQKPILVEKQSLMLKEAKSQGSKHKSSDRQTSQIKRITQFVNKMDQPQKWELILCTEIKQLQKYAQKLTNFYLSIDLN